MSHGPELVAGGIYPGPGLHGSLSRKSNVNLRITSEKGGLKGI